MLKVALEKEAAIEKQQREHLEAQERFAKMKRRTEQKIEKLTKVLEAEDNEEELTKAQRLEMMQEKMQALEELEKAEQEEEERKRLMDKEDLHLDEDEVRVLRGHKAARNLKRPEEKPLISGRDIAKQFRVDAKAEAVMAKNAKKKHQALLVMEQQRQAERVTYQEVPPAFHRASDILPYPICLHIPHPSSHAPSPPFTFPSPTSPPTSHIPPLHLPASHLPPPQPIPSPSPAHPPPALQRPNPN